jgi:hypothetical protein
MFRRKRLLMAAGTLATVGAVAALASGVTFGLFSSQAASGNSSFSAGTVTVSNDASSAPCTVTNLVPGETSATNSGQDVPCTFVIDDNSSVPAWASVDVFIATGKASSVGSTYGNTSTVTPSDLYNPSDATHDLQVTITDGNGNSFPVPAGVTSCTPPSTSPYYAAAQAAAALAPPATDTCYLVTNELLSTTPVGPDASPTKISTLTVNWSLPSSAGNAYEGGDAVIAIVAHEVQSANNGSTTTPSACFVGHSCSLNTGSWN